MREGKRTRKKEPLLKSRENSSVGRNLSESLGSALDQKKPKRKKSAVRIDIYKAWCKACGICVAFCPVQVFTKDEEGYPRVAHPEACIDCGWCEIHCPDFAITVQEKKTREKQE